MLLAELMNSLFGTPSRPVDPEGDAEGSNPSSLVLKYTLKLQFNTFLNGKATIQYIP
jgi:hypothetical protein